MPEAILETRDLRKAFGALVAVDGVSIQVQAGSIHSIIGPNGAGKTTFFNLLSGNLQPTSGQVLFKGRNITRLPLHRTAHIGMGRSFQITNLFPNLTAFENVRLACQAMGRNNFSFWRSARHFTRYTDRAAAILQQVGLAAPPPIPGGGFRRVVSPLDGGRRLLGHSHCRTEATVRGNSGR